jgi:hypothetical protein
MEYAYWSGDDHFHQANSVEHAIEQINLLTGADAVKGGSN